MRLSALSFVCQMAFPLRAVLFCVVASLVPFLLPSLSILVGSTRQHTGWNLMINTDHTESKTKKKNGIFKKRE